VAEEGFRLLGIRTFDLSEHGMLLHSSSLVRLGELVYVSLKAPSTEEWIDAEAVVVRVVKGRRGSDAACGVGLRFERMDALDRAILVGSLYALPPPVPARGLRKDYATAIRRIAEA
jgi:hypothetical protein